ncbi:hypothetical protein [Acinetobacter sp. PW68]|uniref:hypothetical protein n=1 Tax=Acinetobacter sp. PW68 TaxID=2865162 RepID=UPI001E4255E3|nr:hypothetical protein [Acinetobacter sp. PW68]MCD0186979.1 hypothetical protein [Acinetobacter sp. PW68]
MISIDSFPNDSIERVVYLYSCLKLNTSSESDNILVEILLVELDPSNSNRLKISKNSYNKYDVTFRDLDTVQIGSIWKGQTLIESRKFNFNNCLRTVDFEFDFSRSKPKIIRFDDKIPNSEEYYLYNKKIFIPTNEYNTNVPLRYYPLLMSKYCVLDSKNNIEVIINCIHVLHAFYIPARKDIRGYLINENYSISRIVNLFLDQYEIQHDEDGFKLLVTMKKNVVKTIGKEAITLLANLALNKETQEKVLNIRNSLNDISLDKKGKPYPTRFPSVIPPHSTKMSITAEGIWLEDEKRFLITHISRITPIADYPVVAYAPVTATNEESKIIDDDEKTHRKSRNRKSPNNTRINTQEDPSHSRGENKKQTDIFVDFSGFDIQIIEEVSETETTVQQHIEAQDNNRNNNDESSGNRHGNKKNKPRKSENTEKKPKKLEVDELSLIFNSLKKMENQDTNKLTKVSCIDQIGKTSDNFSILQIKPIVEFPIHNTWINNKVGRSLMLLKLELMDYHDHLYLLDIKKNNKNENYCFFLFTTKEPLNEKNIKIISEAIEKKKGTKKWFNVCDVKFKKIRALKHMHTVQSDWINSFNKVLNQLVKNKKLPNLTAKTKVDAN